MSLIPSHSSARTRASVVAIVAAVGLAACGGGSDLEKLDGVGSEKGRPSYLVGGTISGLGALAEGNSLGLSIDGVQAVENFTVDGPYTFSTRLFSRDSYNVTVSPPEGYTCTAVNASGTIARANVSNVGVTCQVIPTYPVQVAVSGLPAGSTLVLTNIFPDNQVVATADGTYSFANQAAGSFYSITVTSQPAGGSCTLPASTGMVFSGMPPIPVVCRSNP